MISGTGVTAMPKEDILDHVVTGNLNADAGEVLRDWFPKQVRRPEWMPVVLLLKEAGELDEHGNLPADTTLPDFVKEYASRRITNGVSPYRQYILGEDRRKSKVSEYREIGDWKGLLFLPNIQQDEIEATA